MPQIKNIAQSHLEVEITYADVLCVTLPDAVDVSAARLTDEEFEGKLKMGGSCGPANNNGSGSIGGCIELDGAGEFCLSNHHVLITDALLNGMSISLSNGPSKYEPESYTSFGSRLGE